MRSSLLLIVGSLFLLHGFGQKFATSPFSSYGIGEFGTLDHPVYSGFGNIQAPLSDSLSLNFYNPSSYSFLGRGYPLFSTGVSSRFSTYSENGISHNNKLVSINHFALGVPFAKRFGIAFGLKPFSRMGYEFYDQTVVGSDSIRYNYSGKGSINDAFTGFSVKLLHLKGHQLGIGTNVSYLFGSTIGKRTSNITTENSGGASILTHHVKSLYYNLGLTYKYQRKSLHFNHYFTLGSTYTPSQAITAFKTNELCYASNILDENTYSVISNTDEKGKITLPSMLDLGLAYTFRPVADSSYNRTRIYQITVLTQYSSGTWSQYATDFASDSASISLLDVQKFSVGLEFLPHYNCFERSKSINYLSRIRYRAGFQYSTLPISRLGKQLSDQSINLGFSFPLVTQRSYSSVNLGLSLGKRGNNEAASLNEKYFGVNFGITVSPSNLDSWFRKYKID